MANSVFDHPIASLKFPALVLVNPAAGAGRSTAYLPRLKRLFDDLRLPAEFQVANSASELHAAARAAITGGRKLLLAMGGDGTFQGLVNAAFGEDVLLGILPAGGGNDFAAALGLPSNPLAAARLLANARPRCVDLIQAKTSDGRSRLYVGGGGVGLDADAARHASGIFRQIPGRFRYLASALRALAEYVPVQVRVDFPNAEHTSIEAKALLVGALNTPTYGGGLRLAPAATLDDGSLHVVLIDGLNKFAALALLPRLFGTGELRTSRVHRWRATSVRLTTSQPSFFHGDGEVLGPTPAELEVVPKAVRVLAPAQS